MPRTYLGARCREFEPRHLDHVECSTKNTPRFYCQNWEMAPILLNSGFLSDSSLACSYGVGCQWRCKSIPARIPSRAPFQNHQGRIQNVKKTKDDQKENKQRKTESELLQDFLRSTWKAVEVRVKYAGICHYADPAVILMCKASNEEIGPVGWNPP